MATFWGRKKKVYQSGLVLALPDAYQMGENFSKPFIKSAFSCSTTWKGKFFCGKGAVFGYPRCLPIEGRKIFFSKGLIFGFSRDLPLEGWKLRYRHNFWPFSVETSERENKNFVQAAIFGHSRCLLFEGRKFFENDSPNGLSQWE